MNITLDMLNEKSRDVAYLSYMHGAGVLIENTDVPDEVLVRARNDRNATTIAKIKDIQLLFENGYLHILNAKITASRRLVLIPEQPADSPYAFNSDLTNFQKQHTKVKADIEKREREWQAQLEADRLKREQQRQLDEQRRIEEEAFLKTPKGKVVNLTRKTKKAIGSGVDTVLNMMDQFSREVDNACYNTAKKRQETNTYIGPLGFRKVQRASDNYTINNYKKQGK